MWTRTIKVICQTTEFWQSVTLAIKSNLNLDMSLRAFSLSNNNLLWLLFQIVGNRFDTLQFIFFYAFFFSSSHIMMNLKNIFSHWQAGIRIKLFRELSTIKSFLFCQTSQTCYILSSVNCYNQKQCHIFSLKNHN